MMKTPVPVIVHDTPKAPDDWRYFAAGLCFIEFYRGFVWSGRYLWDSVNAGSSYCPTEQFVLSVICEALVMARALTFWGFGRAIWRRYPTAGRWLAGIIVCSLALAAAELQYRHIVRLAIQTGFARSMMDTRLSIWRLLVSEMRNLCGYPSRLLLWLMLLICGWLAIRPKRNCRAVRRRPWVILAAVWAFSITVPHFLDIDLPLWHELATLVTAPVSIDIRTLAAVLDIVLPPLAAAWLLLGRGACFLLPLVIAGLKMLRLAYSLQLYFLSVVTADGSYRLALNSMTFNLLFVSSVAEAGPWLLMAAFAWRVPTRMPPDDGSPYPRRYCGRCYYNLHGITAETCPECGAALRVESGAGDDRQPPPPGAAAPPPYPAAPALSADANGVQQQSPGSRSAPRDQDPRPPQP